MDRYESLRSKFLHREKIHGTTMIMLAEPILLEKMVHPGMDFILMDAEHGRFDTQNVIPMLHTCRMLGMPSFLRVQDCQYHLIAKAIDMGADGVMIPRVETLDQVTTAIDALCFSPVGRKGAGGYAQFRPGESFDAFQENRMLLLQIESQKGIDNLPDFLERYGDHITGIVIGPNDLSVMLGTPFDSGSSKCQEAIRQVLGICSRYGKSCGIFCSDANEAGLHRAMGANILWTSSDIQYYMRGYLETLDELSQIQ